MHFTEIRSYVTYMFTMYVSEAKAHGSKVTCEIVMQKEGTSGHEANKESIIRFLYFTGFVSLVSFCVLCALIPIYKTRRDVRPLQLTISHCLLEI